MSKEPLLGKQLGPYRIVRLIGRGGFAWVFLAEHRGLGRQVALKVLFPEHARSPEFVARFSREARIAADLEHPNIVHIYDVGQQDGYHYIAMSYVAGQSLQALLGARGRLSLKDSVAILGQITSALDYAHRRGVVHRDVKPSNILIDKSGKAYLTDFGIAKATWETRVTKTGIRIGTPEYMSPEQAQGKEPDKRSDLYSLGIVLYEMLGGRPPFQGHDPLSVLHKIVYEPTPPLRRINTDVSAAVEGVILHALEKRVDARFQSGAEMMRALAAAASGRPKGAGGGPRADRRRTGLSPAALIGIIAGGAAAVLLIAYLLAGIGEPVADKVPTRKPTVTLSPATAVLPTYTPVQVLAATSTLAPAVATILPATSTPRPSPLPSATLAVEPTSTRKPAPPSARGKVAYATWVKDWHYQVWIMNLDGTDNRMLMDYASEPCFSPDGSQIVYYHWETAGNGGFFIINVDGSGNRKIRTEVEAAFPAWSPDGGTIAYQGGDFVNWRFNIYAIYTDGSGHRMIVDGEQPDWSPDGRIVYKGCLGNDCGLMIVSADGSGKHRITFDADDMNPSWSPDGSKIAFAGKRAGNWEIYSINPDGSGLKQLTDHNRTDALPDWTPDNRQIVFRSDRDGSWGIWIMNADGSGLRKLAEARASDRWRWEKLSVGR